MFKKIPKSFPFFDNQVKKRPISAPRAQNEIKFINGSIKLSQVSKIKQEKNQLLNKPIINFNSKGKKGFNLQLKIEGTLFKPNKNIPRGAKLNIIPHSPFNIKSRNNNILKKNNGQQHHSGTYKSNIHLGTNSKPSNKKDSILSPKTNNNKNNKTPERSGVMNISLLTDKSTHSPNGFSKIRQNNNNINSERKMMSNSYPIKVTKAFRSITPVIKPKYSFASIEPKVRNITPTQNDIKNNNLFYQTTKSQYRFRNRQMSFNDELNKSMKIINNTNNKSVKTTATTTLNSLNRSLKKLHNFQSKNMFSFPTKPNISSKPKVVQQEGDDNINNNNHHQIHQGEIIINGKTNQQSSNKIISERNKNLSFNRKLNEIKTTESEINNLTAIIHNKVSNNKYTYISFIIIESSSKISA